ncbi:MAG: vitamin K epoxide reductase family protein [Streptosporangiaceae bacterium]
MASQKRNRSASRQGKSGGTATRPGPANSGSRGSTQQADRGQNGRGQNSRGQNGRTQASGAQNGRAQSRRAGQGRPGVTQTQGRGGAPAAGSSASKADIPFSAPVWLQWTSLVLSLAGLGMSVYMTIAHYTSTNILVCSNKGYIDCAKVTTSPESMVFSVFPVAVLGLAFYVFMTAINTPWAWRSGIAAIWWARLIGIITGIGFVLYLIYAEVIQIGNLCLDCTTVHIITFLLFVVLVYASTMRPTPDTTR